jgi:hypothetical protein
MKSERKLAVGSKAIANEENLLALKGIVSTF